MKISNYNQYICVFITILKMLLSSIKICSILNISTKKKKKERENTILNFVGVAKQNKNCILPKYSYFLNKNT
jgi:hypothetical protein